MIALIFKNLYLPVHLNVEECVNINVIIHLENSSLRNKGRLYLAN